MADEGKFWVDPVGGDDRDGDGSRERPVRTLRRLHEILRDRLYPSMTIFVTDDVPRAYDFDLSWVHLHTRDLTVVGTRDHNHPRGLCVFR